MRSYAMAALAGALTLSACTADGSQALSRTASSSGSANGPHIALAHPNEARRCPKSKYTLGCVTIVPTGEGETITWSCSGGYDCPEPKWKMRNSFTTVKGKPANRDLAGIWDPNPYHSGPSTYTINLIHERRGLKSSDRVKYVETLLACPGKSSCTTLGTVGIIPEF
jgi:hypothetical protein